jgi:hypothetical protein
MGFVRRSRGARPGKRTKRVGIVWIAVAATSLLVPTMSMAAGTAIYGFTFPARHGYQLLGDASSLLGRASVSFQFVKSHESNNIFDEQSYAYDDFPAKLTYNSKYTKATVTASLGTYGSVSLTFGNATKAKAKTITCPGTNKKVKIDQGVELGTSTGSLTFNSGNSYFGSVTAHKSTTSSLSSLGGGLLGTRQLPDPAASAASSAGILDCIPPLKGKLTYLELAAQGATGLETSLNTFFAARIGSDTTMSATDTTISTTGGPDTSRSISLTALGKKAQKGLYSFSSNLSSATAKAESPFLSGSVSYHETTPCANTKAVTYGDTTGAITAKFDEGGYATYGGPGAVDTMYTIPGTCDNPPPGAP